MKPGRPHKHDAKELLGALHANPDSWDRRFFTVRRHMNVYSPVLYAPAAVGIMLGRQLDLSFAACLYQARLANLLTWIGLTALALRSFPVRGWTVALISLVPMAVYRASVVSADAVTTGFSILSIAAILRSAFVRKGTVTHWETAALVGSTLLLGQGKPGYAPIALLALLIPAGRFRRRGHRVSLILAMALAVSLPSLTWMAFVNAADSKPPMGVWALADPARQFAAIAGAPLAYLGTVAATLRSEAGLHAWGFVGYFAALQVRLPMAWCVFWAVALFALAAVDADRSPSRTPAQSALFVAAFAVSVLVILTGQYIFFNPVGERLIAGFQGRYYIPLAPLLVCALPGAGRVTAVSSRNRAVFVAGVSTLTLGASVFEIWRALF